MYIYEKAGDLMAPGLFVASGNLTTAARMRILNNFYRPLIHPVHMTPNHRKYVCPKSQSPVRIYSKVSANRMELLEAVKGVINNRDIGYL